SITGDLVTGRLEQLQCKLRGQGKGPGVMPRFIDLTIKIIRENDRIFSLGCPRCPLTHMDKVRPYWVMRPVLFQYSDRQYARLARTGQRFGPVAGDQLIPAAV